MPVDAIRSSAISQDEFIKLFLAQLRYQDPLQPLNNEEFLAQLAQFASLAQTKKTNQGINNLVAMNSATQSIELLEKQVELIGDEMTVAGTVSAVNFTPAGPRLTVTTADGNVLTDVPLSQVNLVRP